jgi:hypothetical protein
MACPRYYSPRIERGLISRLYHAAKMERVPMTALASRLIAEGLSSMTNSELSRVAEEPPASDPKRGE